MKKLLPLLLCGVLSGGGVPSAAASHGPVSTATAEIPEGVTPRPASATDLKAVWNIREGLFDISFVAPTTATYYTEDYTTVTIDLTAIEKIEVAAAEGWDYATTFETIANPKPGDNISLKYSDVERGKNYSFSVTVYAFGTSSYEASVSSCLAGAVPGKAENLSVETTQGSFPVTLTFTAPKYYKGRADEIASLSKITVYEEYYDYILWENVRKEYQVIEPAEPGKVYDLSFTEGIDEGAHTFYVQAENEDGAGDRAEVDFFIGIDRPGYVTDLKAVEQEDGSVVVTWGAPVKGAKGGYFDPTSLKYRIGVYVGDSYTVQELASDLTEGRHVYTPEVADPTLFKFGVTASNDNGSGSELKGAELIAGPALSLPFTEGFNTAGSWDVTSDHLWVTSDESGETYPVKWRFGASTYVGNDNVTPQSGEGGLAYISFYGTTPAAPHHLSSAKIDISGQEYLQLAFSYYHGPVHQSVLTASVAFDNGAYTLLHSVNFEDPSALSGWVNVAKGIEVPAGAKTATVRFTSTKTGDNVVNDIIDEISLTSAEAPKPVYPSSVSDFTAVYDKTRKVVDISLRAPLTSHPSLGEVNNEPLDHITRIDLLRAIGYGTDYTVINSFDNPAPGEPLTYADNDLATGGDYYYKAIVYVGNYCDYGQFLDAPVTIGQIPVDINDLFVTSDMGKAPVFLKFTAPAKDVKGEALEEIRRIEVRRYNDETLVWDELPPLTEGIVPGAATTYTDPSAVSGKNYQYRVVVVGTAGSSYGTIGHVFVGIDEPKAPSAVEAVANPDGSVTVSWEAPVAGINDGYVDTPNLTYNILRGNGYSDYDAVPVKENVTGTTFTHTLSFEEENAVKYFVKANNHGLMSVGGISNVVLVGPAATLPYVENFDAVTAGGNITAEHTTWTTSSSEPVSDWGFAELAYLIMEGQVQPVDGGNGLAYVYYGTASSVIRDDYLTSGNINVQGAQNPKLTFHVYGVPGYDSTLAVEISTDNGEFTPVKSFDYQQSFARQGWEKHTIDLQLPAEANTMRMRFHAHKGPYSCSVAIDNISVTDDKSGVAGVRAEGSISVSVADGCIIVSGVCDTDPVSIHTLSGATVAVASGDCKVAVAPSLYIVKAGDARAVKVLVK